MPATRDLKSVLAAAEGAAAAGDFKTAAAELRAALAIQEETLGPSHPDLADTLNNLGVASERAQQLDDAERYYRRALTVATVAFDPGHPFVATSRANLREFCEANGRPFDPPKPVAPPSAPTPKPQSPPQPRVGGPPSPSKPSTSPPVAAPSPPPPAAPAPRGSMNPLLIVGMVIAAVIVLGWMLRGGPDATSAPVEPAPAAPSTTAPATPVPPPPSAPAATSRAPARSGGTTTGSAVANVSLVNPRLCRSLETGGGEWNCDRATSPVRAGALIFLTRVRSAQNTTVQHRWYRGQELVRSVRLSVVASPTEGYRTYSRYAVTAGPAEWRVEARTSDGTLLHEEKFVVR